MIFSSLFHICICLFDKRYIFLAYLFVFFSNLFVYVVVFVRSSLLFFGSKGDGVWVGDGFL